jgi:hypothetical protein
LSEEIGTASLMEAKRLKKNEEEGIFQTLEIGIFPNFFLDYCHEYDFQDVKNFKLEEEGEEDQGEESPEEDKDDEEGGDEFDVNDLDDENNDLWFSAIQKKFPKNENLQKLQLSHGDVLDFGVIH